MFDLPSIDEAFRRGVKLSDEIDLFVAFGRQLQLIQRQRTYRAESQCWASLSSHDRCKTVEPRVFLSLPVVTADSAGAVEGVKIPLARAAV